MKNKSKGIKNNYYQEKTNKEETNKNSSQVQVELNKILIFPGENYEFNEKLLHHDVFGFCKDNLVSKKCAILSLTKKSQATEEFEENVRSIGGYYSPKIDDFVIGTITQKNPEFYKVDIGTYCFAMLNNKDFEGASKKTKPNLNMGDLVFARVLKVNKFDAPVLSCISQYDVKNWASGESFFGLLKNGNVFDFPLRYSTLLINSDNYVLNRLNDIVSFEIVIGHNGKVWINSDENQNILKIYKLLENSMNLDNSDIEKMIHEMFVKL